MAQVQDGAATEELCADVGSRLRAPAIQSLAVFGAPSTDSAWLCATLGERAGKRDGVAPRAVHVNDSPAEGIAKLSHVLGSVMIQKLSQGRIGEPGSLTT
ncbi:hypothetical protein NBRC116599_37330 [Aquicoccus sp. SU-CL01552]